jgi:hypothetical protein
MLGFPPTVFVCARFGIAVGRHGCTSSGEHIIGAILKTSSSKPQGISRINGQSNQALRG